MVNDKDILSLVWTVNNLFNGKTLKGVSQWLHRQNVPLLNQEPERILDKEHKKQKLIGCCIAFYCKKVLDILPKHLEEI